MKRIYLFFLIISLFSECHSKKMHFQDFPVGKITDPVICKNNRSFNYAVYVPNNYKSKDKLPVIFFFDSHASGKAFAERYSKLADKYGFLIIGSNHSKNGLAWEEIQFGALTMIQDVFQRFKIDTTRIYTAGFSGGGRVASGIAFQRNDIAGTISCAAGIKKIQNPFRQNYFFVGLSGNADFNYLEMINSERILNDANVKNQLLLFDGKHEFPPETILDEAFRYIVLQEMKQNKMDKNAELIQSTQNELINEFDSVSKNGDLISKYESLLKINHYLDGIADIEKFNVQLNEMKESDELYNAFDAQKEKIINEMNIQQQFMTSFNNKPLSWWKDETNKLNEEENSKDREKSLVAKRLKSSISIASYMNINSLLQSANYSLIAKILEIYQMVDPENPDYYFFKACYLSGINKTDDAMESLKKAVSFGFSDMNKLKTDQYLSKLQNREDFKLLVK